MSFSDLPAELQMCILESAAKSSLSSLLSLSSTTKTFRRFYKSHERHLLNLGLRYPFEPHVLYLPLLILGSPSAAAEKPKFTDDEGWEEAGSEDEDEEEEEENEEEETDDLEAYSWTQRRISADAMDEVAEYFGKFLEGDPEKEAGVRLPSLGELRRAYAALRRVRAVVAYCVEKRALGVPGVTYPDGYSDDPLADAEDNKRRNERFLTAWGRDSEGWIYTVYWVLLHWLKYQAPEPGVDLSSSYSNLPASILPDPSSLDDRPNPTPSDCATADAFHADFEDRWDMLEDWLQIDLAYLVMRHHQGLRRMLRIIQREDEVNRKWHTELYPTLRKVPAPSFAFLLLEELLWDEDHEASAAYGQTDRDWNFAVWIVVGMLAVGEEFAEEAAMRWAGDALDGNGRGLYEGYCKYSGETTLEKGFYLTPAECTGRKKQYLEARKEGRLPERGERMYDFRYYNPGFSKVYAEDLAKLKAEKAAAAAAWESTGVAEIAT